MTTLPPIADFLAIQQLIHDLWLRTDRVVDAGAETLFTDQARMQIGTLLVEGRAAIDRYHVERRASEDQSGRHVRHLCTNLLVVGHSGDRAELRCSLIVFQGRGEKPFASDVPSNIADFLIGVERTADGQWLIASLDGTAIFVGPGAPGNAR